MSLPVVVLVGANGAVGPNVVKALASPAYKSKIAHPIRIVTSSESKIKEKIPEVAASPKDYKLYTSANAETGEGLKEAFDGADIVINAAGITFSHKNIVDAAVASKVKVYLPSEFGVALADDLGPFAKLFDGKKSSTAYARSFKELRTVSVYSGTFYEYTFSIPGLGGLTSETTSTVYSPDAPFASTSLVDIGKVVAAIATKALNPTSIPEQVYFRGALLTRAQIAKYVSEATGKEVKITEEPAEKITEAAQAVLGNAVKGHTDFITVLVAILTQGYAPHSKINVNEVLDEPIQFETPQEAAKRISASH